MTATMSRQILATALVFPGIIDVSGVCPPVAPVDESVDRAPLQRPGPVSHCRSGHHVDACDQLRVADGEIMALRPVARCQRLAEGTAARAAARATGAQVPGIGHPFDRRAHRTETLWG